MTLTMKRLVPVLCIAAVMMTTGKADVIFSIDLQPEQNGIQSTREGVPGQRFMADVVMAVDQDRTVTNYQVSLDFNVDELQFIDAVETPPMSLFSLRDPMISGVRGGEIDGIEAGTLANTGAARGEYRIATLQFELLPGLSDEIGSDFRLFEDIADGTFNDDFTAAAVTFRGGSVILATAVPEPTATVATLIGMTVIVHRRRRHRRKSDTSSLG